MNRKTARRTLLFVLLVGLLLRVVYITWLATLPYFQDPVGDPARYLERAAEIAAGEPIGARPFFYGATLYPYLLAASITVFGRNMYPIALSQGIVGLLLAYVLYRICVVGCAPGYRRRGRVVGLIAAVVAVLYGPFAFLEASVLMISWTLLLVMTAMLLLLGVSPRFEARRPLARLIGAGACLGLAASERPNLVVLIPVLAFWIMILAGPRVRIRGAVSLLAGGGIVIGSIAWINHATSGRWIPLTTSAGINFFIGNHEGARGTFDEPWASADPRFTAREVDLERSSLEMARRMSGRPLDPADASRFWMRKGLDWLSSRPGEAAFLYVRKLGLIWNAREIPNHMDFEFVRAQVPLLWLMPLGFGVVAPLGLLGLVDRASRLMMSPQMHILLVTTIGVTVVTLLPFFVADRYRVVMVPSLILGAAWSTETLVRRVKAGDRTGLVRRGAVLALLGILCFWPLTGFDASRGHWIMARAHQKAGDLPSAVQAYQRALEEAPGNAVLLNNLGVVYGRMGLDERAEATYRLAIDANPSLVFPRKNLGLLLIEDGRVEESFEHLVIVERSDPEDLDVLRALAALFMARGMRDDARVRAEKVIARDPDDRTARAVLEALAGSPSE